MLSHVIAAGVAATISLALPSEVVAGESGRTAPTRLGFKICSAPTTISTLSANRTPNRSFVPESLIPVKTKFKVEAGNERYPEDRWSAWLRGDWVVIPPEKIVQDYAPDGQPYLFLLADTIQCFVRPKGGL